MTSISPTFDFNYPIFENLKSSGKDAITFLSNNKFHLTATAVASALYVHQWFIAGTALLAFSGYRLLANAVALQTWIPRSVRLLVVNSNWIVFGAAVAVAITATKSHVLGMTLLICTAYHVADQLGLIPRSISLGIERYFPLRSLIAVPYIEFSWAGLALLSSCLSFIPAVVQFSYNIGDLICHKLFNMKGPTISEVKAPFVSNPVLTYNDICTILNSKDSDFELNIAHTSRGASSLVPAMPEDRHFEKMIDLVKNTSWSSHSQKIFAHRSFIIFLKEEFPSVPETELTKEPQVYAEKLAKAKGLSKENFAHEWLQERFVKTVDILNGKWGSRVKGSQSDLDDAIADTAKIVPYLENMKNSRRQVIFDLALGSASHKAEDIKAAAERILHPASAKHVEKQNFSERYKFKVRSALQDKRLQIIQNIALTIQNDAQKIVDGIPDDLCVDFAKSLDFGFLPLSDFHRINPNLIIQYPMKLINYIYECATRPIDAKTLFDVDPESIVLYPLHLINWVYDLIVGTTGVKTAFDIYRENVDSVIAQTSQREFWNYIDSLINQAPLTPSQKAELQARYSTWLFQPDADIQKKFRRLALVSMGVLKITK